MLETVKAFHDAFRGSTWAFVLVVALGFAVVGGVIAWAVDRSYKNAEADTLHSDALSRQLSVEWHMFNPAVLPPEGRINILGLFEIPQSNGGGGLGEMSGKPGNDFAGKDAKGMPLFVRQYKITNYSSKTMFNTQIALHLVFREAIWDGNQARSGNVTVDRDWVIYIPKIDPGTENAFVFYAMNNGKRFVSVSFPDTATAQMAGTNARDTVQLIKPGTDYYFFAPAY